MNDIDLARRPEVVLLAAANAHTKSSALHTLAKFGYSESILTSLEMFGLLSQSSGEWQFEPRLRRRVLADKGRDEDLWLQANLHYLALSLSNQPGLPTYLSSGPGFAYHSTEIDPGVGAHEYREVAEIESLAANLQGLRLADEQADRGLIGKNSPDLQFLRAMTYYRSQRQPEAVKLFRSFIKDDDGSREIAIAQHLVAHWECHHGSGNGVDELPRLFRQSLANGVKRGDNWHQAHVKHSMALCLIKQRPKDAEKAVALLRSSLELLEGYGDDWGRAKVLHSLGQVLTGRPESYSEAKQSLEESRNIGSSLGYMRHVRQVDLSLQELSAKRPSESTRRRLARKRRR
ncbi:hypothetical protein [Plantibacter sp. 2H11-2]|uniref:hypothetical protein n=1 Tax=Plantibacter sp. 2H11-2 TaxID=3414431 RepID=UPI003CF2A04A